MIDVSVVIPVHDRAHLIRHTLNSVSADRHPGVRLEVIVVDDGSSDGGAELVAHEYPQTRLFRQQQRGAPAARNRGLAEAQGAACLFLDSDDLIDRNFFATRLAALETHAEADGAYGPWEHFAGSGDFEEELVVPRHAPYPTVEAVDDRSHLVRLLAGWYIPSHAVLWRTQALRRVSGQDETLVVNQDVDLMFRILASGHGIVGCRGARALIRQHSGSREGEIQASRSKVADAYLLRRRFADSLRRENALDQDVRDALARYCFDRWAELRYEFPEEAAKFLALSRELEPALQLHGRLPLRLLSRALGPARALMLRHYIHRRSLVGKTAHD
ncbi:MAG: glycosyltransferase [Gemmatimonadaceae bacterium]